MGESLSAFLAVDDRKSKNSSKVVHKCPLQPCVVQLALVLDFRSRSQWRYRPCLVIDSLHPRSPSRFGPNSMQLRHVNRVGGMFRTQNTPSKTTATNAKYQVANGSARPKNIFHTRYLQERRMLAISPGRPNGAYHLPDRSWRHISDSRNL